VTGRSGSRKRLGPIAWLALLATVAALGAGVAPAPAGAKKPAGKPKKHKPVRASRTILKLFLIETLTANPQVAVMLHSSPLAPACLAGREVDLHVYGADGDRIAARIYGLRPGKDGGVLMGASFPVTPGDRAFYLAAPAKQAGPTACSAAQTPTTELPLPA
jgi:hypothetical protein